MYVLNNFCHHITSYEVFVYTNHSTIKYLMNIPTISSRLVCWPPLLQEFNVKIIDKLGWANVVVDFLSRLQVPDDPIAIDENFPNEHLFSIESYNPWLANIENYLAIGRTPPKFSLKHHCLLVEKSFNFSWIVGLIF